VNNIISLDAARKAKKLLGLQQYELEGMMILIVKKTGDFVPGTYRYSNGKWERTK